MSALGAADDSGLLRFGLVLYTREGEYYTVYCVLCTVYCVLCTVYCVLCTVYCVLSCSEDCERFLLSARVINIHYKTFQPRVETHKESAEQVLASGRLNKIHHSTVLSFCLPG